MNNFFKHIPFIKYQIFTEKTGALLESNQYTFLVDPCSNKLFIKKTIEDLLKVKIIKINTSILPQKQKRKKFGNKILNISKPKYKKVIITVRDKNLLTIFKNQQNENI